MPTVKEVMIEELIAQHECDPYVSKDIVVVVRDQPECVRKCVESLFKHTTNFTLWVWDNGSAEETRSYLETLSEQEDNVRLFRSEANDGFIIPNNQLAAKGEADFLILLNSDTEVMAGWAEALIGWVQKNPKVACVGYEGGMLGEHGMGIERNKGTDIDYVMGWCLAMPRKTYREFGLFDQENLTFAYCEDSDLGLRLKESGHDVYALNITLVLHHANVTARTVKKEMDLKTVFVQNHDYFKRRHADYLENRRVLLSMPHVERAIKAKVDTRPEKVAEDFCK
jgi:GT2 family glycosyltransferase